MFEDSNARVIRLERTQKKQFAAVVAHYIGAITTKRFAGYRTYPEGVHEFTWKWRFGKVLCRQCGKVKREKLKWISENPFYTKRFAFYVGQKCRAMTIQDMAKELKLDWHTVKALEKQYM